MSYFRLKWCSPKISHSLLLALSILIGCWGIVHLVYAITLSIVRTKSIEAIGIGWTIQGYYCFTYSCQQFLMPHSEVITHGAIIYYAIVGSLAIILSVVLVLVLREIIWKQRRKLYFRLIFCSLIVVLLIEFGAAVYSSFMLSIYQIFFRQTVYWNDQFMDLYANSFIRDYCYLFRNFYRFTKAQVIITWILIIPSIAFMIYALIQKSLKAQDIEEMDQIMQEELRQKTLSFIQPV